jgi:SH3-like domain-containing protein
MALFSPRAQCALYATPVLFLVMLSCLILGQQPAGAQEGASTFRVVGVAYDDVLNIRSGPSMGHAIVGVIPPRGRGVRIVGECEEWCPVRYNGASGWVNRYFLLAEPAEASYDRGYAAAEPAPVRPARKHAQLPAYWRVTGVAEGESLKVHEGPSQYASVVHAFEPQSGCIRLSGTCRKPWCQVAFAGLNGDRVGWVDSKHLAPAEGACTN